MRNIVLIGSLVDPTMGHTVQKATLYKVPHTFLETKTILINGRINLNEQSIEIRGQCIEINKSTSVYNRIIMHPSYTGASSNVKSCNIALLRELLRRAAEKAGALVCNIPHVYDPNQSKALQLIQMKRLGFNVPRSIATNSPAMARIFVNSKKTIYKSLSSDRSIVSEAPPARSKRYDRLRYAPTLLQEKMEGYDVRVHIVGSTTIGEMIISKAIDYRYHKHNSHMPIDVPSEIDIRLRQYMAENELQFIGADFKVSEKGEWTALEINTMPGYSGYDDRCGGRISEGLLELLRDGVKSMP